MILESEEYLELERYLKVRAGLSANDEQPRCEPGYSRKWSPDAKYGPWVDASQQILHWQVVLVLAYKCLILEDFHIGLAELQSPPRNRH